MRAPTSAATGWWLGLLASVAIVTLPFSVAFPWHEDRVNLVRWGIIFCWAGWTLSGIMDRTQGRLWPVTLRFLRGVIAPLWLFIAFLVAAAWWRGELRPIKDLNAAAWLFPYITPHAAAGLQWGATLRLLTPLLWCALLTPMAYWLFRRWPRAMLMLPLVLVAMHTGGLIEGRGPWGEAFLKSMPLLACWFVGFAVRDGVLYRWRWWKLLAVSTALVLGAWAWAHYFPDDLGRHDFAHVAFAGALTGLGVTLFLARVSLLAPWVARVKAIRVFTRFTTARLLTILVWTDLIAWVATADILPATVSDWFAENLWEGSESVAPLCFLLLLVLLTVGWCEALTRRRFMPLRSLRLHRRVTKGLHENPSPSGRPVPDHRSRLRVFGKAV